jgi:hypothetical protein
VSDISAGLTITGSPTARDNARTLARGNLELFVDALNQDLAGTYIFGGRRTDSPPVVSTDAILNGNGTAAGLRDVIAERKRVDGSISPATGRLSIPAAAGNTVSIAETGTAANRANFGFILNSVVSSNPAAIAATTTAPVATDPTPTFATNPADGDVVRLTINQPDGSQKLVDYTARATTTPGPFEFSIGANAAATGAGLKTKLGTDAPRLAAAQSATPPSVGVTFAGGSAGSVSLAVNNAAPPVLPKDGDTVTVTLGLRDGTTTTFTMTAKTVPNPKDPLQFGIDANPNTTAANLQQSLLGAVKNSAATTLSAASATLASADFFAGSSSAAFAPRRINETTGVFLSNPAYDATHKTVIWYTGDDTAADPRTTASVRTSAGQTVGIGAQANESGIRNAIAGLAALAVEEFADTKDPNNSGITTAERDLALTERERYSALTDRIRGLIRPSDERQTIAHVATELSLSSVRLDNAKTQNNTTVAQLQNTLDGTDSISTEEVVTKLLTVQNQLQASYQLTSTLSKLSLVNYL